MKGFYIEITNNLLDPKHRKKMGTAVWEFMWCLDKITKIDENQVGWVYGGKPIKLKEIQKEIGITESKISKNINKLKKEGYLNVVRVPHGIIISVNRAKKRFAQKGKSDLPKRENQSVQKGKSNIRQDIKDKTNNINICDQKSPHKKFIEFFYRETQRIRGIKPIITGKDAKNLKRIIDLGVVSIEDLEKMAVYFLMNLKKFAPSISIFLSAGIFNGLMDKLRNDPEFWHSIENYNPQDGIWGRLQKLKVEMFGPATRTAIQEEVARQERRQKT